MQEAKKVLQQAKKTLLAVVMGGLLTMTLCAVTGCQDNSEEVIRQSLTEEIDEIKAMDDATVSEMASSMGYASTLSSVGISSEELVRAMLQGFDGVIDSVTVDGNTAEAVVTFTSKDFSSITENMDSLQTEMTDNPEQFADMSRQQIMDWVGERTMQMVNELPVVTHEPVTITYEREGNTWAPTAGSESAMYSTIFG